VRNFQTNEERKLTHIHFIGWEDLDTPDQALMGQFADVIIQNAEFVIAQQNALKQGEEASKLLVHCRGGMGRTGTALAMTNLAIQIVSASANNQMDTLKLSPFAVVHKLRT